MGPRLSSVKDSGSVPVSGTRLAVGFHPTSPHKAAGIRQDPPVSDPSPANPIPSAVATAAPEDDPPGRRPVARSQGLRGVPKCGLWPRPEKANSTMLVRPSTTKPAR